MSVISLIERALTIRSAYHKVLAGNIANADTPNYKEKEIERIETPQIEPVKIEV